ncbi:MAG: VOC family protein [Patescibacteria group bacterium]
MKVHHLAISIKDLEKSVSFYAKYFDFKDIQRFTKTEWEGEAAILDLYGFKLEIFQFHNAIDKKDDLSNLEVIGLKHISIEVDDVESKYIELKEKGIDIDKPEKGTTCAWFCFLRDPDGIPIELYESK